MKTKLLSMFFLIAILLLTAALFAMGLLREGGKVEDSGLKCVPSSCCHPSACVTAGQAPDCSGVFCTQVCEPGTLDCGQGRCEEVNGECQAILNE